VVKLAGAENLRGYVGGSVATSRFSVAKHAETWMPDEEEGCEGRLSTSLLENRLNAHTFHRSKTEDHIVTQYECI
jgi:hypothetical protein